MFFYQLTVVHPAGMVVYPDAVGTGAVGLLCRKGGMDFRSKGRKSNRTRVRSRLHQVPDVL
jgi:hypothetical protein